MSAKPKNGTPTEIDDIAMIGTPTAEVAIPAALSFEEKVRFVDFIEGLLDELAEALPCDDDAWVSLTGAESQGILLPVMRMLARDPHSPAAVSMLAEGEVTLSGGFLGADGQPDIRVRVDGETVEEWSHEEFFDLRRLTECYQPGVIDSVEPGLVECLAQALHGNADEPAPRSQGLDDLGDDPVDEQVRTTNNSKLVRNGTRGHVVDFSEDIDPNAAADLETRIRFQEDIRTHGGVEVSLDDVCVADVPLDEHQRRSSAMRHAMSAIADADAMPTTITVSYAYRDQLLYIEEDVLQVLSSTQLAFLFKRCVEPAAIAWGADPDVSRLEFVPSALPCGLNLQHLGSV